MSGNLPSAYQLSTDQSLALWSHKDGAWWASLFFSSAFSLWVWCLVVLRQLGVARGERRPLSVDALLALRRLPQAAALIAGATLAVISGTLLFLIPGVYFAVALWPSLWVLMAEGGGARGAADRALRLVRGQWWHTANIIAMTVSALLALYVVGVLVALAIGRLSDGLDRGSAMPAPGIASALLAGAFQPLLTALGIAQYAALLRRSVGRADAPG